MSVEVSVVRSLDDRVAIHAALADGYRLRLAEQLLLSDRTPSAMASALGVTSSLLAHHVRILEAAGLVRKVPSSGDGRRSYLQLTQVGHDAIGPSGRTIVADRILFVCAANSARSQLAAGLWNLISDVPAESAGTHPADRVHPRAVAAGRSAGLDLARARPRPLEELDHEPDLVITVCDVAGEELDRRAWAVPRVHWSVPDPLADRSAAAFPATVRTLSRRIDALAPHVVRSRPPGPQGPTRP